MHDKCKSSEEQPAEQPEDQPEEQPEDQPAEQPAEQPTEQPAEQPAEQPDDQPIPCRSPYPLIWCNMFMLMVRSFCWTVSQNEVRLPP
jgi:hypothetical protein